MRSVNKRPISYLQTDKRWSAVRLPCVDGSMSIGGGGCGPTSAAMLIETLTGKQCLPTETFAWCCDHGFVFSGQGTSYYAFRPLFKSYGLSCEMIDIKCLSATSPIRPIVLDKLREGYYLIALMKQGLWTKNGHYVVVWWADGKVRINDPASTKYERLNGDPDTFFSQAKYFWLIDARKYNRSEDLDMTKQEFLASLTPEEAAKIADLARQHKAKQAPSQWAEAVCRKAAASPLFADADKDGVLDAPQANLTRQEFATVLDRMGVL